MTIEKQDEDKARSPLIFPLDPRSGVPTYFQLVHQVEHAIRLGYLVQGDQLPRLKDVVASLSIYPNTVQKAYRDLEQQGLIGARPGQGTFVLAWPETVGLAELEALRKSIVEGWLRGAAAAGLDEEGISTLIQSGCGIFVRARAEWRASASSDATAHHAGRRAWHERSRHMSVLRPVA